jgi:hypothetical protein
MEAKDDKRTQAEHREAEMMENVMPTPHRHPPRGTNSKASRNARTKDDRHKVKTGRR